MSFKRIDSKTNEFKESRGLCLEKSKLLEWDEWSPASKKYIESHGFLAFPNDSDSTRDMSLIDLEKAIEEYQRLISLFYEGIEKRVRYLYRRELNELMRIQSEIDSFLP